VFLVNVPICGAAIVLGHVFVPDSRDEENRPLDPLGVLLSICAMAGILYAIIEVPSVGWTDPGIALSLTIGVAFLGMFAAWELHVTHPMLDLRFFRNPRFSAASATITITFFAYFASTFLLAQYLQFVLGYPPLKAGLLIAPSAVGLMLVAPNAPKLVLRYGTKRVVVCGLCLISATILCYGSNTIMSSFVLGGLVRLLIGAGFGMTTAPATESIMGSLPLGRAGVGSAVNDTTRQTGGALGVAVIGSLFLSQYHRFTSNVHGFSKATTAALQDSIGTALTAAQHLPPAQAARVEALAQSAFLDAMRITYPVTAAIFLLAAFVAWRYLPARAAIEDRGHAVEPDPARAGSFEIDTVNG
jgi:MFS family permease